MKKIMFVMVAFVGMCIASCNNASLPQSNGADTDTVVVDTVVVDSVVAE